MKALPCVALESSQQPDVVGQLGCDGKLLNNNSSKQASNDKAIKPKKKKKKKKKTRSW